MGTWNALLLPSRGIADGLVVQYMSYDGLVTVVI
jgi:hypothetical protein